jgi:hypothetical protein
LFYNTKISDNIAESRKVPECLQRFHVEWQGKSSRKGISLILNRLIPMTLMKSMASLHQRPKVSNAKLLWKLLSNNDKIIIKIVN